MQSSEQRFKALGDRNRLRIVMMLKERPLCACEITEILGLAPSTASKHLSLLRGAGLAQDRRRGKWVVYSRPEKADSEAQALFDLLESQLAEDPQVLADRSRSRALEGALTC